MSDCTIAPLVCIASRRLAQLYAEAHDWDSVQQLLQGLSKPLRSDISEFLLNECQVADDLVKTLLAAGCTQLNLQRAEDDFSFSGFHISKLTELNLAMCSFLEPEHLYDSIPSMSGLQSVHLSQLRCLDDASIRVSCLAALFWCFAPRGACSFCCKQPNK